MAFSIAYQLFSARDTFDADMIGHLESLKRSGYDGVELAGYYGVSPHYLRGICDVIGLKIVSAHLSYWTLTENIDVTISNLKALGCEYVAIPGAFGIFIGSDYYPKFLEGFEKLGFALADAGITLLYHNHAFEFEKFNGDTGLDVLYSSLDPGAVSAELDAGFANFSGYDPVKIIRQYKGRIPVIHIKDYESGDKDIGEMTCPAGEGVLDLPGILDAANYAGTKWLVVEQDRQNRNGKGALECAAISASNLLKLTEKYC